MCSPNVLHFSGRMTFEPQGPACLLVFLQVPSSGD